MIDFSDGALIGDKKVRTNRTREIINKIFLVDYMAKFKEPQRSHFKDFLRFLGLPTTICKKHFEKMQAF